MKKEHNHDSIKGFSNITHHTPKSNGVPVLLVHGLNSYSNVWFKYDTSLGSLLECDHRLDLWALNLSSALWGNIKTLAHEDLFSALHLIFHETEGKKVRIIGHSMGGLLVRYLLSTLVPHPYSLESLVAMIEGVTLLATPNHGTR